MGTQARRRATTAAVVLGMVAASLGVSSTSAASPGAPDRGAAADQAPPSTPPPATNAPPTSVDPSAPGDGGDTSLKAEYDEISAEEAALLTKLEDSKAAQERLTTELVDLQAQVLVKRQELLTAQIQLTRTEETAAEEAQKRKDAEARVARARERLRAQIVASYVSGGSSGGVLEALLRSHNGEDAGNAMAYSHAVVGDSDQLVRELEDAEAAQKLAEEAAKDAKTAAQTRRDEVGTASEDLATAVDGQVALLDDVKLQVAVETDTLNEIKGQKAKIEGEIAALGRTSDGIGTILAGLQANQPDWKAGDALITNPIPGYSIGSSYGLRKHPILGTVRLHAGGDMGAPAGTPIYAPADGVVVIAAVRGGYGNATVIDHGFSLATLYGHQSRIDVVPGQAVKRGEQIGLVGSTGLSTGPHLHFETRLRGVPTDPNLIVDFARPADSYEAEQRLLEEYLEALLAAQGGN